MSHQLDNCIMLGVVKYACCFFPLRLQLLSSLSSCILMCYIKMRSLKAKCLTFTGIYWNKNGKEICCI